MGHGEQCTVSKKNFFHSAALDGRDHFQRGVFNAYQDQGSSMCEIDVRLASARGIRQE